VLFSLIETEAYFIGIRRPDDGRGKEVWNVCRFLPDYTAQHPRRRLSSKVYIIKD
jgi:hypothetical protein